MLSLEKAKRLSRKIWKPVKPRHKIKKVEEYPYLIFVKPSVIRLDLKNSLKILSLNEKSLIGYRSSIMLARKIEEKTIHKLYEWLSNKPETNQVLKLLEETYLELAGHYGEPINVGGEHIWGSPGLFEYLNRKLVSKDYRPLSWEEFKGLLKGFNSPDYYGKIYVSWILSPKGLEVEPKSISFYFPVYLRKTK